MEQQGRLHQTTMMTLKYDERLRRDKIEAEMQVGRLRNLTYTGMVARLSQLHRQQVARVARCDMVERLEVAVLTELAALNVVSGSVVADALVV